MRHHAASLEIDENRIGLWSCSGNVPAARSLLARAGHDQMPRLNDTLDHFVAKGLACNLPFTFVNHPNGPHAFDVFDDSETSREVVRRILAFLRFNLLP